MYDEPDPFEGFSRKKKHIDMVIIGMGYCWLHQMKVSAWPVDHVVYSRCSLGWIPMSCRLEDQGVALGVSEHNEQASVSERLELDTLLLRVFSSWGTSQVPDALAKFIDIQCSLHGH
jgi:hypothetical protein